VLPYRPPDELAKDRKGDQKYIRIEGEKRKMMYTPAVHINFDIAYFCSWRSKEHSNIIR